MKKILLIILGLILAVSIAYAAVVIGTSCGFLAATPVGDPDGLLLTIDGYIYYQRDTAPAGATSVTEIGFWASSGLSSADIEVGIYTDSGDAPANLIDKSADSVTTGGNEWISVTGLSIPITESTTYWIAVQMDAQAGTDYTDGSVDASSKYYYDGTALTELPSVATYDGSYGRTVAVYAVYGTAAPAVEGLHGATFYDGTLYE